ncbi:unnamed protein product [Rotaria magnacalcarata]|nr:unnamed protein product [Rotaria magnacalcarata]
MNCGGDNIQLKNCMSPTSYSKDFPSMLEYLSYRAALFHLQPTNLYHHHICLKHWKYLTSAEKKRCIACRLLREQDSASSSDVHLVSKPLAIGIWEEGQPANNLAMYDRPICGKCRKYYEEKYLTDEMREKADTVFGMSTYLESAHSTFLLQIGYMMAVYCYRRFSLIPTAMT